MIEDEFNDQSLVNVPLTDEEFDKLKVYLNRCGNESAVSLQVEYHCDRIIDRLIATIEDMSAHNT